MILRETGYEAWHTEPLVISRDAPQVARVPYARDAGHRGGHCRSVRFERSGNDAFSLHDHVGQPNWRAQAQGLLQLGVQTPGVQAWLVEREATVACRASPRTDFREHSSPLAVNNGQSTVVSATRAKGYERYLARGLAGVRAGGMQIDEGYVWSSALVVGRWADDRCDDQVHVDQWKIGAGRSMPRRWRRQRTKIEVPQLTSFRFHERPAGRSTRCYESMGVVPCYARRAVGDSGDCRCPRSRTGGRLVLVESKESAARRLGDAGGDAGFVHLWQPPRSCSTRDGRFILEVTAWLESTASPLRVGCVAAICRSRDAAKWLKLAVSSVCPAKPHE